ncbi:putative reverse transcriptase domain-containing protein [Tanacetum coccineum]
MIDQGVTAALAARDALRSTNGEDSYNSGTSVRRNERATRECTYPDFMKTEIKKLEVELWDLKVKGTDVIGYNQRFQELALLCVIMFPKEYDKIERYVGGLPDMIHESVVASKPKTMQEATEIATELMDKRICTFADRTGENKLYGGSKIICPKCNYHHDGPCAPKCHKCNRVGHLACDCKSPANGNTANNQRGNGTGQNPTCFECSAQGHFKRECPKLKNNNNRGNPAGNVNAPAKVYAVGHAGTNPYSNVVTDTLLLICEFETSIRKVYSDNYLAFL